MFKLTHDDYNINQNQDAQETNMASEFLSYKFLYKLLDFTASEDIDLFTVFHQQLFLYILFQPVTYWRENRVTQVIEDFEERSALQIYDFVNNGPQKIYPNRNGELRFPSRNSQPFITYKDIVEGFESSMEKVMNLINAIGNPILKQDLGYDITFEIRFVIEKPYELTLTNFVPPKYKIELEITDYEGLGKIVKKPHTFLNEAKLTSVGLVIRLAVLQQRLQTAKLKILVLDDLLISLDMANRDVVLDLLLNKYAQNYQLFILTHDAQFTQLIQHKIKAKGQSGEWINYEMYEDQTSAISKPYITQHKRYIERAKTHYNQLDYEAAGNYLRKETERFCKDFLPRRRQLGKDFEEKDLNGLIIACIEYAKQNELAIEPFKP